MAKIVKLRSAANVRLGLKRVRKNKQKKAEDHGQLNLFAPTGDGKVINLSAQSSFEEAIALDEIQQWDRAKSAYLLAIKRGERIADAYCNLGILEFQDHQIIKAINCFTKSIQQAPRHFQAHYNLANLYSEQKNFDLARFHYQVAIEIAPNFPDAYYNLGLVLALNHHYQEAIDALSTYKQIAEPQELGNTDELIESLEYSLNN